MPGPVFAQVVRGLVKADAAAATALDPVEDLLDAWPFGQAPQLSGQELLQRLPAPLGPALQGSMDVIWKVTHEHIRQASTALAVSWSARSLWRASGSSSMGMGHDSQDRLTASEALTNRSFRSYHRLVYH